MKPPSEYQESQVLSAESLVEQYAPLVKRVALHLLGRLPAGIELDDLIQVGLITLLDAARNYTPAKGASFETYARIRLRGAMLDEVRNNDWAPRSVYRRQREVADAVRVAANRLGREPQAREVAEELGIPLDEYHDILANAATAQMRSLDEMLEEPAVAALSPLPAVGLSGQLKPAEFTESIAHAISELPERESLMMSLYYIEELNLKEIGAVFGVSESRVSQIHSQAAARLRAYLEQEWGADHDS